ncbi:MAG: biopolymer transporter ExbD [Pseudomonadota bacterium]|nr:biopolymer transporter ExbD [Pseudomonadota bacterium]
MTPLIDMVFILLIFFAVTSSFTKEAGVEVQRPSAHTAVVQEQASILVGITSDGEIWIDKQVVDVRQVRRHVERLHAEHPEGSVVILADENARTGVVIEVLDQARLAGVENVAVAAAQPIER